MLLSAGVIRAEQHFVVVYFNARAEKAKNMVLSSFCVAADYSRLQQQLRRICNTKTGREKVLKGSSLHKQCFVNTKHTYTHTHTQKNLTLRNLVKNVLLTTYQIWNQFLPSALYHLIYIVDVQTSSRTIQMSSGAVACIRSLVVLNEHTPSY